MAAELTTSCCLLCLDDFPPGAGGDYIEVNSARGTQLDVAKIVGQHFPVVIRERDRICDRCWKTVIEFHTLHEFVSAAQSSLEETKVLPMEDDPLTQNEVKASKKVDEVVRIEPEVPTETDRNFFYPEVKIEEHELDHLPKIEILENTNDRRLRKRVKAEGSQEDGLEGEPEPIAGDEPPKKRRGRPRKVPGATPTPVEKSLDLKSEEKLEFSADDDVGHMDDEDDDDNLPDPDFLNEDSIDSDSSNSQSDTDSDFELNDGQEKLEFADIPKRTVQRPKKYKKRSKPAEPKVRMSRELIEQRKKQQEEYDEIIAKFFNKVLACSLCNLLVHNFTEMQRHHRLTHQVDPGYMMCCGRKFTQRKVLAEHVQVHWNPEHFKCLTCSKSFQNSRHLESHQQVHLDPSIKLTFTCDLCSKTFLSKTAIDYHKLNKHVPKSEFKFTCSECNKKFLTERKLKNHMNSIHDPESTIICDKCGKQMRTKIILKKHQELMHSDKPRPEPELKQCQICGAWLKGMTGLKQHMKSIHVESAGEHRCHICSKVSPNARALRRHIYHNHECERKFKCTMCEKAFKRPQELREHTSTHTGEVLYTCPNCPMTFFCSANMYKHRQRLHRAQYEADKSQPKPPNILKISRNASSQSKTKQEI